MRFFPFLVILAAAAQGSESGGGSKAKGSSGGGGSKDHFLTLGTAFNFAYDSACLSVDLGVFTMYRIKDRAFSLLPPDVTNMVNTQYSEVTNKISTLMLQAGVPGYEDAKLKTKFAFYALLHKAKEMASPLMAAADPVTKPLQEKITDLFDRFSQAYPNHATKLPTALYDQIFVLAFLFYIALILMGFAKRFICLPCKILGICCGKRNAGAAKRGAGRYSDQKSKKNR